MLTDGADYFAIAPTCPIPNEMSAVRGCDDAACGDYCVRKNTYLDFSVSRCKSNQPRKGIFHGNKKFSWL
jgi:hypothetical protein